jgi:exodeoxyribonuclease V gamma subunit
MELYLEEAGRLPDEREPLEPNDLEKWMIGDALLKAAEDGLTTAEMLDPLRARGVLPPRSLGQVTFGDIEPLAARIGAAAARRRDGRLEPVPFEITAGGVRLTGTLRNLSRGGLVEMQYSKLERNQELRLWIRHLVLQRIAPRGTGVESVLVGRGKDGPAAIRLKPVSDAQARLAELIDLYQRGLESPLPLFRTSSRAYAATFHRPLLKKKADVAERAAEAARKAFAGDGYRNHGDWNDPYVRLVYNSFRTPQRAFDGLMEQSSDDPLSFAALARRLWDPMLEHREEIEA